MILVLIDKQYVVYDDYLMEDKGLITIRYAAEFLKISKDTLRRWEKKNIIKPYRSPTGRRYYDIIQLSNLITRKSKATDNSKKLSPIFKPNVLPSKLSSIETIDYKSKSHSIYNIAIMAFSFFFGFCLILNLIYMIDKYIY